MAEWLSDATAQVLAEGGDLDSALRRYTRCCRAIEGHHAVIADFARARPYNLLERLMYSAEARDRKAAKHFDAFGSRRISLRWFLSPVALVHAGWVNVRHALRNCLSNHAADNTGHGKRGG